MNKKNFKELTEQEIDKLTLEFLNKQRSEIGDERFSLLSCFGVKALDIIKYITTPYKCKDWGNDYLNLTDRAVNKICRHCALKEPLIF